MRSSVYLIAVFLVTACVTPVALGSEPDAALGGLVATAESAVAQAEATEDRDARGALYDEAIAAYNGLLERGVVNASIHRNIGTVYLLKGDTGRAVVSLRRADRLDPIDPRVAESLAAARALVRTEVGRGTRSRVLGAVFFWRGLVPRTGILWAGLGAWAVLWLTLAAALLRGRLALPGLVWASGAVAVVAFVSLAGEHAAYGLSPSGVVVEDGVEGYRGPSDGLYEPTYNEPIRAGVEGAVLEHRDGWVRLRLRSGSETWVPETAVEII